MSKHYAYFGTLSYCGAILCISGAAPVRMLQVTSCARKTWLLRWLSTCEFSCASSVSDSFCRVDTALTETVGEFLATVESRLADSFHSRGYGRGVFLSDSLRVLAATSKRFYSARNCRQFQHVEDHGTTHRYRSCVTRNREIVAREPRTFIHVKKGKTFATCGDLSSYQYLKIDCWQV